MKTIVVIVYLFLIVGAPVQAGPGEPTIETYFERIRHNRALLRAFFSQMPKGGDLHNHLAGAIYPEYFLNIAIDQKLYVNLRTLALAPQRPAGTFSGTAADTYVRIDSAYLSNDWPTLKQRLVQNWSIKDFYPGLDATDKHFFDAFAKFPKISSWDDNYRALLALKVRAQAENVQYLEEMLGSVPYSIDLAPFRDNDLALRSAAGSKDTAAVTKILQQLYDVMESGATKSAQVFCGELTAMHRDHGLDDANFTMRYILSTRREQLPMNIFTSLLASFKAAELCPLVVGINFVSPEDGEISMRDYSLHMLMFRFLHRKFPTVHFSLHAGEMTLGLVQPEDLTFHINEAVFTAGANRIGHGVDMPFEHDCRKLMAYMVRNKIAIEINLASNEFILGVHDDVHPITLYAENKVPIVLSTDDPGILRTNMTEQFVLLAMRYPNFRYADIRQFILNSIEYSFIKDAALKQRMLADLKSRLAAFEKEVVL